MAAPATRTVLSPAQIDQFQDDGFLVAEEFFAHDELDRFGAEVDQAVLHRTRDDGRRFSEKNLYEQTFVQCMRLWEDHPTVRPFTFHPGICKAAADLLQTDCVRLWHDQALYKEAGGRNTDAHLDYPFWPVDRPELVSVWIPFHDVLPGGGMMSYVRGSHNMGITQFVDIGQLRGGEPYDLLQNPEVSRRELVPVAARKGSAVFHHAATIHAADANETDATRRVFTMAYIADGRRRSRYEPYFSLDREGIRSGEKIVGAGFPIAWPNPDSKLPSPPAIRGPKTGFAFSTTDKAQ